MSQHVVKVQGRWQPPPPQPPQQPPQQLQPHFIFLQILVFFLFDSMRLSLCRFKTEPPPHPVELIKDYFILSCLI